MSRTTRYDYIIVGAGVAGCVLANRISADPATSVLLLEAGPDATSDPRVNQPSRWLELLGSEYDWGYRTTPQRHLNQRTLDWPRGRVIGGSSSLNAMVYIRGNAADYDAWVQYGGPKWSYAEMLPWFAEVEGCATEHGSLSVVEQEHPNTLSEAFVAAGEEIGLSHNPDFN